MLVSDMFKFLKTARVGTMSAKLHLAWAAFEKRIGNVEKANAILTNAIRMNAEPVHALKAAVMDLKGVVERERNKENRVLRSQPLLNAVSTKTRNVGILGEKPIHTPLTVSHSKPGFEDETNKSPTSSNFTFMKLPKLTGLRKLGPPERLPKLQSSVSPEFTDNMPSPPASVSKQYDPIERLRSVSSTTLKNTLQTPSPNASSVSNSQLSSPPSFLAEYPNKNVVEEEQADEAVDMDLSTTIVPGLKQRHQPIPVKLPSHATISAHSEEQEVTKPKKLQSIMKKPEARKPQHYEEYTVPLAPDPILSESTKSHFVVNGVQYKRIELIGRGASSKVFKILNEKTGQVFAMKKVKLKGQDPSVVDGYVNEISLLKKLVHHERIIRMFDAEINLKEGMMLMVLEYGEIDLAHLLKRNESSHPACATLLSMNFIRNYWEQMLQAVQAIHDQNIIHSDLKPANFLLVEGCLKLIDFGIAKTIPNDTTNIQRDHQSGTANYMAPEAILFVERGDGKREGYVKIGRASDVWSLGCILYQFVYGFPPFANMGLVQKLHCIVDPKHVIPFPEINASNASQDATNENASATRVVVDILKGCLKRDAKQRPSISELLDHPFLHPDRIATQQNGKCDNGLNKKQVEFILEYCIKHRLSVENKEVLSQRILDELNWI